MFRKFAVVLILILFLLPLILAQPTEEYTQAGNSHKKFSLGSGDWIDPLNPTSASRLLTAGDQIPYVKDLDGDGVKEIIVLDDDRIRIFKGTTLDIVDTITFATPGDEKPGLLLFDIDGDNLTEIITTSGSTSITLHIIEWNGTALSDSSFSLLSSGSPDFHGALSPNGDMAIQCRGVNDCLIVWAQLGTGSTGSEQLRGKFFNSTAAGIQSSIDFTASGRYCLDKTRSIQLVDHNGDGTLDYVFSTAEIASSQLLLDIQVVFVSGTTVTDSPLIDDFATGATMEPLDDCDQDDTKFTNVIADNFDEAAGTKDDYAIAYKTGVDEFNINIYDNSGSLQNNFPDSCVFIPIDGDGDIVSNLFRASVFGTGTTDVCVFGHNPTSDPDELEMVCANLVESTSGCDQVFQFDGGTPFNITLANDVWTHVAHSADYNANTNPGEILSTYGTFTTSDRADPFFAKLQREFSISGENAVVTIDANDDGSDDMLLMTSTGLAYLDDGLTNNPGEIDTIQFNPCPIGTLIQLNTTMQIDVVVKDQNPSPLAQDQVSASLIMYEGSTNEFRIDSPNVTSGTTIPFAGLFINKTVTLGTIKIIGRDTGKPAVENTITQLFTVAEVGLEFGESQCTSTFVTATEALTTEQQAEVNFIANNSLKRGVDQLGSAIFGVPASATMRLTTWLVFMIIVGILVFTAPSFFNPNMSNNHPEFAIIGVGMIETLMLILGVLLGFISIGILITIVVIAIIFLGIALNRMFNSNTS